MNPLFELSAGPVELSGTGLQAGLLAVTLLGFVWVVSLAHQRLRAASLGRRLLVQGSHALLLFACVLLLIPPSLITVGSQDVVLLTEGSGAPSGNGAPTYAFGIEVPADGVQRLRTPGQLLVESPDVSQLAVYGHGLSQAQWQQLPVGLPVEWLAPTLRGVTHIDWPARVAIGETVSVTGQLRGDADGTIYALALRDPAGVVVDEQALVAGDDFSLRAVPVAPGTVIYRLQLSVGDQLVSDDPVGVQVISPDLARFHIVQSAPSFETRQFSNWASDHGAAVMIQTQISRERDLLQRVNLDASEPAGLVAEVLGLADLLLMDGRRWASLSVVERAVVLEAVREGLGLVLTLDDAMSEWISAQRGALGISVSRDSDDQPRSLEGQYLDEQSPLPVAPWRIETVTAQSLTRSTAGEVLESVYQVGEGRIVVSRLTERHRWLTGGDRSQYTRYWASMVASAGRPDDRAQWLLPESTAGLRVGERMAFCATYAEAEPLSVRLSPIANLADGHAGAPLALTSHHSGTTEACAFVWPATTGWHRLDLVDAAMQVRDVLWVNILGEAEFRTDVLARRQLATSARRALAGSLEVAQAFEVQQPLARWWAWVLMLLALTPLWVERRLAQLD